MKLAAMAALVVLTSAVLAGCAAGPEGQSAKADDKDLLLEQHVVANCPVAVNGAGGLEVSVEECGFSLDDGALVDASIACEGLGGNTNFIPWGNRESSMTVSYYTPKSSYSHSQVFTINVESGETATGSCTIKGPTTGYGKYEVRFDPECLKDSEKFLPGFQARSYDCHVEDDYTIEGGWSL